MKKKLLICLAVVLCVFACFLWRSGSRQPRLVKEAEVQVIDTQAIMTVTMDKNRIYNPLFGSGSSQFVRTYRFWNKTDKTIEITRSWLETSVDGVWYQLEAPPTSGASPDGGAIQRIMSAEGVHEYPGDHLSPWRDQLTSGKYRRVWAARFQSEETPFFVAVEFTVI